MTTSNSAIVLTAGEALIDLIEQPSGLYQAHAGGAVFNAARALALLGLPCAYLNPLSRDRFGQLLRSDLTRAGVLSPWPESIAEPTSLAVVSVNTQGAAQYGFYREGIADKAIDSTELIRLTNGYTQCTWALTGCLALTADSSAIYLPWLAHCKVSGIRVVVDANMRLVVTEDHSSYRAAVLKALAFADVIKASDEDLEALQITNPQVLFELSDAKLVVVTRGAQGASCYDKHGAAVHVKESRSVVVADTVGAGDCFLAGFVSQLAIANQVDANNWQSPRVQQQALAFGVAAASINVQRQGCQPPSLHEVSKWMRGE